MRVVCIIQARMNSTRLPGKAMLPLAGKSMTQNIIERVTRASKLDEVVLAFPHTDTDADTTFAGLAVRCGVGYYRGVTLDENDLVGRYLMAATCWNADIIVRVPGDNPCVQGEYIDEAVESYLDRPQVYVSTMYRHVRDCVYLDGVGAEVLSYNRLQWLDRASQGVPLYREHPHKLFEAQHLIDGWEQYCRYANVSETVRLDVNTREDYEFIRDIYDHFGHNRFTVEEVLGYLDSKEVHA